MKKNKIIRSRKWALVLLVFWVSVLAFLSPPLLSVWLFGAKTPLVLLSGTEFVSLITLVVSAYFGANVMQKHVELKNASDLKIEDVAEKTDPEDEGKEA